MAVTYQTEGVKMPDRRSPSARLIDGGKSVEGRLTDKEQIGSWTRLVMEVVLND